MLVFFERNFTFGSVVRTNGSLLIGRFQQKGEYFLTIILAGF